MQTSRPEAPLPELLDSSDWKLAPKSKQLGFLLMQGKRKHNWVIHVLGVLLLGRSHPEGTWAVVRRADSRFLQKYGALFTDNRGPPMVLKGATYQADPVTGWVNRGKLESHPGQPLLSFG